jgi:uncharacterized protein YecE (DUF72 family)
MNGRDAEAGPLASVGTSGFSYGDWKGAFYPSWLPSRDWFHYYATRFRSIEINLTFYRSPTPAMLGRWLASSPPGFQFVLKASQAITHHKRLADCEAELAQMAADYSPLGSRLACILFQLPPSLRRDDALLRRFRERAGSCLKGAEIAPSLAFEFRHPSWNAEATLELLVRHGCTMVIHDMAAAGWHQDEGKLKAGSIICTSNELLDLPLPLLYLRFHGTSGKYAGEYGTRRLEPWALLCRDALERSIPAHAYFNNAQAAAAVRDALQLAELIGG